MGQYRGRLAPSPTGAQHIGNARTYLLAWLAARSIDGELRLRIEDIDSPRIKPGAIDSILEDLRWLGLDWDGAPVIQSRQSSGHQAALDRLKGLELIYPCTCTRSDIEQAASAPHLEHEGPRYPGTCSHRSAGDADRLAGRPFAWRFRVVESPTFEDRVAGHVDLDIREIGGDFVVWKSSGTPAYQLAVVVDDAAMAVNEIVRGDDLLPSTPRQILLQRALERSTPRHAHVPLVIGADGRRLAKRHGDTRLETLRRQGVSAESLIGLLGWSCGLLDQPRPVTARELLRFFSWDALPRSPFVLTNEMLHSIGYDPSASP